MGFFSKIKHHVKRLTKSAEQRAKEDRELAESVTKGVKEQEERAAAWKEAEAKLQAKAAELVQANIDELG